MMSVLRCVVVESISPDGTAQGQPQQRLPPAGPLASAPSLTSVAGSTGAARRAATSAAGRDKEDQDAVAGAPGPALLAEPHGRFHHERVGQQPAKLPRFEAAYSG